MLVKDCSLLSTCYRQRHNNIFTHCKSFNTLATDDFSAAANQIVSLTFDAPNNTFVIDPATFPVMITDDNITEGNEDLFISLTQVFTFSDIVIRSPDVARLIIQDNGMAPLTRFIFNFLSPLSLSIFTDMNGGQC